MSCPESTISRDVRKYCAEIGVDPLFVQGAGGNVSWKEGSTLWIKASGTWLSNAEKEEIFIPVDLAGIKSEIEMRNFSAIPKVVSEVKLKPSIETMLHALMPQRIVLHLHAVEILAHLVREDFDKSVRALGDALPPCVVVEYCRPGAELAMAVNKALEGRQNINIIFLKNHGVVIGVENINEARLILLKLTNLLAVQPFYANPQEVMRDMDFNRVFHEYTLLQDFEIQQLALNNDLFMRLSSDWALYPDHVVFLGPKANIYKSWLDFEKMALNSRSRPELAFVADCGVFSSKEFSKNKQIQLRCYYDVLVRQSLNQKLSVIPDGEVDGLLNWDAEKYRVMRSM